MRSLNKTIQTIAAAKQKRNRIFITAVFMSLLVVACVCYALIRPAVSLERPETEISSSDDVNVDDGKKGHPFEPDIFEVKVTNTGSSAGGQLQEINFQLSYGLDAGDVNFEPYQPYIYYKLDNKIQVPSGGLKGAVTDGDAVSGYYVITEDGYIIIRFKNEYLNAHQDQAIAGTISFTADVSRGEGEQGSSTTIDFNDDHSVTIDGFPAAKFGLQKSGTNNNDRTITWKITIDNPNLEGVNRNLNGYYIIDDMLSGASGVNVSPSNIGYAIENNKFTINSDVNESVTITYTTPISPDKLFNSANEVNKANLFDSTGNKKGDDDAYVWVGAFISMEKSGTADYNGDTVTWTIKVNNEKGIDLGGFTITDNAFGNATTSLVDNRYTVNGSLLTFNSGVKDTEITITYTTPLIDDSSYTNTAKLQNEDKKAFIEKTSSVSKPVSINKWSDGTSIGYFSWVVEITNNSNANLKGYAVEDDLFNSAENLVVKTSGGQELQKDTDYIIDNGKLTIINNSITQSIRITYKVPTSEGTENSNNANRIDQSNTAKLFEPNNSYIGEITQSKDYYKTNSIKKWYDSANVINDTTKKTVTIPWTVTIEQENDQFAGKTFTDEVYLGNDKSVLDSLISVAIKGEDSTANGMREITLTENTDYTVTISGNNLTINFTDNDTVKKLNKVTITYTTVTDYSGCDAMTELVTGNKAVFGDKEADAKHTYFIPDDNPPYIKYDGSLSSITGISADDTTTSHKPSELERVTVGGVEYYLLKYQVLVNQNKLYQSDIYLVDTLPAGFSLYEESGSVYLINKYNNRINMSQKANEWDYNSWYEINNNKITFRIKSDDHHSDVCTLYYSAKVPVDIIDEQLADNGGSLSITNTIVDQNGAYDEVTQTQEIKEGDISKYGSANQNFPGRVTYTVDFNKDGKNLASGSTVTLTDILKTVGKDSSGKDLGPAELAIALENISIYRVDANGNKTPLSTGEFNYTFDNSRSPLVEVTTSDGTLKSEDQWNGDEFKIENAVPGSEVTLTLKFDDSVNEGDITKYTVYTCDQYGNRDWNKAKFEASSVTIDKDKTVKVTFTVPEDYYTTMVVVTGGGNGVKPASSVSAEFTKTTYTNCAKLQLTVPDSEHLSIEYTYLAVRADGTSVDKDTVNLSNEVSYDTGFNADNAINQMTLVLTDKSTATSYADTIIELRKVDIGNDLLKLDAQFELYKYDNGSWLPAVSATLESNGNYTIEWGAASDTAYVITTNSSDVIKLKLNEPKENVNGVLFKVVEVKEPTDYIKLSEPYYFSCGFFPETNARPSDVAIGDVHLVTSAGGQILAVDNAKNIEISVDKKWSDTGHENDSVTVELYRSTVYNPNGLPSASDLVKVEEITLDNTNNWLHKWDSLINGDVTTGQAYYYYVVESKYTVGGQEYIVGQNGKYAPAYDANALNQDGSITITNNKGLTVEKIWLDEDGKTMAAPDGVTVTFDLYVSTQKSTSLPTDAEKVTGFTGIELNAQNDWKKTFTSSDLEDKDSAGNTLYYYVVETSNISGYTVSYNNNATTVNATISIVNTAEKVQTGVTLPETGGKGIAPYVATGVGVIALALAGYVAIRFSNKRKV